MNIELKRRSFPSRFARSYRAFRQVGGRVWSARWAWRMATCGTNLDVMATCARALGWCAGVLAFVWHGVVCGARWALSIASYPASGLFWCGFNVSTALKYANDGKALAACLTLLAAVLIAWFACWFNGRERKRAELEAFERGVAAGRAIVAPRWPGLSLRTGDRLVDPMMNETLNRKD